MGMGSATLLIALGTLSQPSLGTSAGGALLGPGTVASAAGTPGGDIPDSAVCLRYTGRAFSIEYIEGWLQTTATHGITFNDKDSRVTVDLRPSLHGDLTRYVQHVDLPRLKRSPGFRGGTLRHDSIDHRHTLRLKYRARSAPDPVTGKTVTLQNDRYYVQGPHALAVVTLSTPLGVDNVDAFRRISHSFRFR